MCTWWAVVGHYNLLGQNKDHGFLLRDGKFTTIDVPDAEETEAGSINSHGDIAGYYRDANKKWHGFVLRNGKFATIDYPGAKYTQVWRMNDSGQIVGRYAERDGTFHLYRLTGSQFESFDFPGAVETAPGGYSIREDIRVIRGRYNKNKQTQNERTVMNPQFYELTKSLARSVTRRAVLKQFGVGLAGMALACWGMANVASAQTSLVCDSAGDATFTSGKGGPKVPAWFDIVQSEITDADSDIHFTLALNGAIPAAPAWNLVEDGGQIVLQQQWEISRLYAMFATPIAYLIDESGLITQDVAVGVEPILALLHQEAKPRSTPLC